MKTIYNIKSYMQGVIFILIAAVLLRASCVEMAAVAEKGAEIDVLEKRISCLERRILTSEEDVQGLKGSSVAKSYPFSFFAKPKEFKWAIQT